MADYDASQAGSTSADTGPTARPDVDSLPAGSMGPASGNTITGAGTITGQAGADTPGAGGASVVEVHGAGGATSGGAGNFQASGQYGVLSMDAQGNYNYVRNPGTPDGVRDVFQYTLADAQGANSASTLTIDIGQALTANAGIVNLPAGVELSDIHVVGRDLVIDMPDGTHMVIPNGAVFVPQLSIGDVAVPASNVAALLIDSEPQPAAGNTPSSGGNFADPVPPLDPGVPLGDLIPPTELSYNPPDFRPVGQFIDTQPTVVIVTPDNPAGAVDARDQVDEAGLPARTIDGVAEPQGSDSAANSEQTSGSIVFVAQDGLQSVTINGVAITADSVGDTITGEFGTLTITSVNLAAGTIGYTYAISDNTDPGGDNNADHFAVAVTDTDGDVANATLTVDIIDDTPTARNDTDSVDVVTHEAAGNVITAVGTTSSGADTVGADDAHITGLSSNNVSGHSDSDASGGFVVDGEFGTLTMNADGSYNYVLHDNAPGGSTDVFTYTLTDGDGDPSTATLTINNPDRPVQITNLTPQAQGGDVIVDEDDLQDGSDPTKESTTVGGSFNISAPDGVASLTVGGVAVVVDGVFQVGAHINTPLGNTLTFTGYNAATGEITYTYTLLDNEQHPNASGENSLFENFSVVLTDTDGDTDTDTLSVNIVDDVPTARADTDATDNQTHIATGNVITGADTTSGSAGADTKGADGAEVTGLSQGGHNATVENGALVLDGQFGQLTLNPDGSYTYVLHENAPGGSVDVFTYTLTDGDGDTSQATLTINNPDHQPTLDVPTQGEAGTVVDEKGLPPHGGLPAGSGEIADSNPNNDSDQSEQTSGTISFTPGDSPAVVTINGVAVTGTPGQQFTGAHGTLEITGYDANSGTITYTYTLTESTNGDNTSDSFSVSVTDVDGDQANGTLKIDIIDDVPTAHPDTNSVSEGGTVTGNVETNDVPGADGYKSGGGVTGVEAGSHPSDVVTTGVGNPIAGTYGTLTLNADGSYSYHADANTNPPQGATDVFTYTITDGDGDTSTTTLTIAVNDVTLTPDNDVVQVNEAALDTSKDGNDLAAGTVTGSTPGSTAETVQGQLVIAGVGATGYTPQSVTTAHGTFQLNADGSYTYTLTSPFTGSGGNDGTVADGQEVFTYTAQDANGNTVSGTITVNVLDDVPTAQADTNSVSEGGTVTGNVETNDVFGADGKAAGGGVTGVEAGSHPSDVVTTGVGNPITGTYGTLTLNADGSYSYHADANTNPPAGATDVFTYTITDGDGDKSTTTLTIAVNDVTLTPDNDVVTVNEAALDTSKDGNDLAAGTVTGSNPSSTAETVQGQLAVANATGYTAQTIVGTHGTIQINANGSYTYTLTSPVDGTTADNGTDTVNGVEVFTYTAHDANGNTINGTITVNVIDDVPTAHADTNTVTEGGSVNGNVLTDGIDDVFGADGKVTPSGGVTGVATGSNTSAPVSGNVGTNLAGSYGTLHLNADGTYTYTANPNSVTTNQVDHFVYTITDGDGDTSTVTLDINVNNVTLAADNQTKTVDEAALAIGSNPSSTAETVNGTLAVAGATGYTPAVIVGTHGTLTLNANGTYSYTLTTPVDGTTANNGTNTVNGVETFSYTAHDANGNTVNGTITINVIDDVPTARNDADSVTEDGPLVADGNVFTGVGGSDVNATDGVADTPGADGATVTGIKLPAGVSYGAVSTAPAGTQIVGAHGTLTIHADGSYSYQLNNADSAVQALGVGQTTTDTFNYQLTDGDGDLSNANLVITINGANDAPVVGNGTASVSEEGLTGANPDTTGSPDTTNSVTANGTISITDVDTSDSHTVTLTAPATALMSGAYNVVWTGSGTNTLHAYADVDGSGNFSAGDTPVMTITIDNAGAYTVTLQGPLNHADATSEDLKSFGVTVNVNDGTTTSTGTLTVNVEDDSPKNFSPQDMNDKTNATVITSDNALVNDGTATATNPLNDTNNDHVGENFIGADGFGSLAFTATGHTNGEALKSTGGTALTSHGNAILLSGFGTDTLVAYTESGAHAGYQAGEDNVVFTATLNTGTGYGSNSTYTIDFNDTIDDGSGVQFNNLTSTKAGNVDVYGIGANAAGSPDVDAMLTATSGGNNATINTNATSIGVGNQSFNPGDSLRIDFVTAMTTDAGNAATGFDYGVHVETNGYQQKVAQVVGNPSTVSMKVWAIESNDTDATHPDSNPTGGFSDPTVNITEVWVVGHTAGEPQTSNFDISALANGATMALAYGMSVTRNADGSVTFSGMEQGDSFGIGTGSNTFNAVDVQDVTGKFDLGIFALTTTNQGNPIDMSFGVTATDHDGDTSTGTIDVSLVPAASGSSSAVVADTLMATSSLSTQSASNDHLVSSNDNHRSFEEHRSANTAALLGAIAAAGLSSAQQVAAEGFHPGGHQTISRPILAPQMQSNTHVSARDSGAHEASVQPTQTVADAQPMSTSHLSSPSDGAKAQSFAGQDHGGHQAVTQPLHGTDAPVMNHGPAPVTAASIAMPSAQMLAAHMGGAAGPKGGAAEAQNATDVQSNAVVGKVLADALAGGHGHGPNIDALLQNAVGHGQGQGQGHGQGQGQDALAALASYDAPAVSFGHSGVFAGFHNAPIMEHMAMQPDAAPIQN